MSLKCKSNQRNKVIAVIGCCGAQLYVERLAKAIRKGRADAEKAAAEAVHASGLRAMAGTACPTSLSLITHITLTLTSLQPNY